MIPRPQARRRKFLAIASSMPIGTMKHCPGAAALLVLTEWNEFRRPDFVRIKQLLKHPVIFDGRNLYDPADIRKLGFQYYSIGRNDG